MSSKTNSPLFQLIKSLKKGEKRNFKLFAKRNTTSPVDLKSIILFDALDKMENYDELLLLKKNKTISKVQLSNMNAHLYKLILSSLRIIKDEDNIDIQLREQMDFARILYNKGFYLQSLNVLDKMKKMAKLHHQPTHLIQILFFEKKIESLYITRSIESRADELIQDSNTVLNQIKNVTILSNLALKLYSWYITNGHVRTREDAEVIKNIFTENLPANLKDCNSFYEKLYLYQSNCWYAFIQQDFLQYYRHTQKWVNLFTEEPLMLEVETAHYIKGVHNLMFAHFDLGNYKKLNEVINGFEKFSKNDFVVNNESHLVLAKTYLYTAKINLHFVEGTFTKGIKLIPEIEIFIKEYAQYIDRHRVLVFYYKFASLYFGSGDNDKAIDYLNKIINWKVDLRTDLQCYSRLLNLIAHYELGNYDLLEYLIKSVYRFMAKMENMSIVEEEIFKFLRQSFNFSAKEIKPALEKLLKKLKAQKKNKFETRAFLYLDVISWIESKINNEPVEKVIRNKFLELNK